MDYTKLVDLQSVTFYYQFFEPVKMRELAELLLNKGFVIDNELMNFPRSDKVENWQSDSIVYVEFLNNGSEIYLEGRYGQMTCDRLNVRYNILTLPETNIQQFLVILAGVDSVVKSDLYYENTIISINDAHQVLFDLKDKIETEFFQLGSEENRMFLRFNYP